MPGFASDFCARRRTKLVVGICVVIALLTIAFLPYFVTGRNVTSEFTLVQVNVVFRHGDRTPTDTYPNDPYGNVSFWPQGWGALTQLGMRQMHSLGLYLRKRYDRFLGERYSADDVYVVSSDHDRCLMSAELCLAGLYPPKGDQVWNRDLPWQPIPIHTVPKHLDQLIVMRKPCPAYDEELSNVYRSPYVSGIDSENSHLYEYLSEKSGARIDGVLGVERLYNTLEIEERNGLGLPPWTEGVYPKRMRDLAAVSLALFTHTDTQKRLKGGPLIADIAGHLAEKVSNAAVPNRRLFLYSGHDLNLVSSLRVLGFDELRKPETGAALIVELRRDRGGKHGVRLLYLENAEASEPQVLSMPGCSEVCSVDVFLGLVHPHLPQDWDKECLLDGRLPGQEPTRRASSSEMPTTA